MSTPTYVVKTLGCQMNVHDSERMAGLLESAGYEAAPAGTEIADVVVINTCAVRENAANKLYGNLGQLAHAKSERPGMQIAVGGCLAQKDRGEITRRAPWVDVVFGTHNIDVLPVLLAARAPQRGGTGGDRGVAKTFPLRSLASTGTSTGPVGSPSPSAATTLVRSASSPACAARSETAGRAKSSPKRPPLLHKVP